MTGKINGESLDISEQNIELLKKLFPEVCTDGEKIDFDRLKTVLGEVVEDNNERYQFTWYGKKQTILGAQTPSKGTLLPVLEKSKNFDTTENLFIEGDNLEVLKILQKSYNSKIKVIYIDPPYNTGKDFVYKDNFQDGVQNYLQQTGQINSEGNKLNTNTETDGRFHTDWLNMMYPRLKLARNLLTDDGVIFMSIDDSEFHNLLNIGNEIFGEKNKVAILVWEKKKKGSFLAKSITNIKEYIVVYCKNKDAFTGLIGEINTNEETYPCINANNKREVRIIPAGIDSKYREENYFLEAGTTISDTTMNIELISDLIIKDGKLAEELTIEGNWRYSQEAMTDYANKNELYMTRDLYIRRIVKDPRYKTMKDLLPRVGVSNNSQQPFDLHNLFIDGWGSNEDANEEQRLLFGVQGVMSYPKPLKLIQKLIASYREKDLTVLDFFSGSATTAHAVMQLNAIDEGKRKFILVQLPENLDQALENASDDNKAMIKNAIAFLDSIDKEHFLTEIGEERIRRAGEKIKQDLREKQEAAGMLEENAVDPEGLDVGFKVFKLDNSNIREWNTDFDHLEEELDLYETPFIEDRTEWDIVYEIMLKYGLEITYPIQTFEVDGKNIYDIASGHLFICLGENINTSIAKAIIAKRDEYGIETSSVVFSDAGFNGNDSEKLNCIELLKDAGYPEDNLLTI